MIFEFPQKLAVEVPPAAKGRIREKRKIEKITTDILYGESVFIAEPTVLEIYQAVAAGDTEVRAYDDTHKPALYEEFHRQSGFFPPNPEGINLFIDAVRKYHARRVAYFVLSDWENQIIGLDENGCLRDGGHRLRAAMFMGWDEVWVDYPAPS